EAFAYGSGGDREEATATFPEAVVKADNRGAELKMPKGGGGYRLFAYVYDGQGGAAVVNVPLRVNGPEILPSARRAKLPLVVYDDGEKETQPFVPAGWMGNAKA